MYERRLTATFTKTQNESRNTTSMYQMAGDKVLREELNQKADMVTHRLKELIHYMQDPSNHGSLVPCAEHIRTSVLELIKVFAVPVSIYINFYPTIGEC